MILNYSLNTNIVEMPNAKCLVRNRNVVISKLLICFVAFPMYFNVNWRIFWLTGNYKKYGNCKILFCYYKRITLSEEWIQISWIIMLFTSWRLLFKVFWKLKCRPVNNLRIFSLCNFCVVLVLYLQFKFTLSFLT